MQLFYTYKVQQGLAFLDEEESRHLQTVLRRKEGDRLQLTDGNGAFFTGTIESAGKKEVIVRIETAQSAPPRSPARLHIALAPTKQIERFEWFLEKAAEIGVDTLTPLLCERSERRQIRADRLEKILQSAMKQSLQAWMPRLQPLTPFESVVQNAAEPVRCIAWCGETAVPHLADVLQPGKDVLALIGPEGDFSPEEIARALAAGFQAVNLGPSRLRTETAGVYAVTAVNLSARGKK
jgi:16S rRNA (uracil1498-N3)-methyltransferase